MGITIYEQSELKLTSHLQSTIKSGSHSMLHGRRQHIEAIRRATFTPAIPALNPNTGYVATITTAAANSGGIALASPVDFELRDQERIDGVNDPRRNASGNDRPAASAYAIPMSPIAVVRNVAFVILHGRGPEASR